MKYDPRFGNIHFDANALDRTDPTRSVLVDTFHRLAEELRLSLVMPKGVRGEINNPRTPEQVRAEMPRIFTLEVGLTDSERRLRAQLREVLTGNAQSTKHHADADHIFEASKYGGRYYVTHDQRVLDRKVHIRKILGVPFEIVTLSELVEICRQI